jgi:hypothetical protein
MFSLRLALMCAAAFFSAPAAAQQVADPAVAFGAREAVQSITLSPDGKTIAFVQPTRGQGASVHVVDLANPQPRLVTSVDGEGQRLSSCDFVSSQRLVCNAWAVVNDGGILFTMSRPVAFDTDGGNVRVLGERDTVNQMYVRGSSGRIIDYLPC